MAISHPPQGWFSISKARYSMGNKQVSALQYASEIEPLVHVHTRWGISLYRLFFFFCLGLRYWQFYLWISEHWTMVGWISTQKEYNKTIVKTVNKMQGQWKTSDLKKKVIILWFLGRRANLIYFQYFLLIYTFGFSQVSEWERGRIREDKRIWWRKMLPILEVPLMQFHTGKVNLILGRIHWNGLEFWSHNHLNKHSHYSSKVHGDITFSKKYIKNECNSTVNKILLPLLCYNPVLELSAEIAALQTSVINTRQELKRLMNDKRILEEKALEEKHSKTTD